jgi:acyl-CoA thioesterase I
MEHGWRTIAAALALGTAGLVPGTLVAAPVTIVALGASNTAGKGVSMSEAFPAQLEAMLRARGYDARVINAGVSGDTPQGMLSRLGSAVPEGTRVVILNPGGNDLRGCRRARGGRCATREEHDATVGQIVGHLRSRGISVVMARFGGMSQENRQADARHLTPEAHRAVASRLLPQVVAAMGAARQPDRGRGADRSAVSASAAAEARTVLTGSSGQEGRGGRGGGGGVCAQDRIRLCGTTSREGCPLGKRLNELTPACRARVIENRANRR